MSSYLSGNQNTKKTMSGRKKSKNNLLPALIFAFELKVKKYK